MQPHESPQLTDLYQLTMLQSYLDQGMDRPAVFEFFVRSLPARRNFLVSAGLEQLLDFLAQARFSDAELDYLAGCGYFQRNLIDYLARFRFSGEVYAIAEGSLFFGNEPLLRVCAPLPEAQLIETRLINLLQLPTLVATKAARCRLAAGPDKLLVDFGLRRAHGAEAGLLAARACYIGGFDGSSNVLAGQQYGLPIMGTMAHSYIQAHEQEADAFRHFVSSQPGNLVLLIDTYDTARGAARAAALADELQPRGLKVKAVRIDSGELDQEAMRVREILDKAGHPEIGIFASSSIDEYLIEQLSEQGAPIDGYGIGTSLTTSEDAPFLNCAYKLQEYAGIPRRKRSSGKATWPGVKQLYRHYRADGKLDYDRLCCAEETDDSGQPLLQPVMRDGRRLTPAEPLSAIRRRVGQQLASLPVELRQLSEPASFRLEISEQLQQLARQTDQRYAG
ncbi:nicotinate phosphoribosyltransferase [Marinobacterium arenosum]|uniref:nicotinate phosphoribosyltransferase n=1 Tax=Marinobacterium arenosum TaxID=2862496 RepID=UPI001C960E51|nr:nicotinate phosphoribosyltransferase [Marinobacterium arenosum]MBY4676830.1 nicotinate phosphoribosyltransferase [Marinobacterium arenosum]